ncbi:SDR family NAD(P)-dependent oxidoreductase, partial [Pseudofrankia sp. BMG5.36]
FADDPGPVLLAWCGRGPGPVPAATRAATHAALRLVQDWLADERLAAARLVVVTTGAVTIDAGPVEVPAAAVWGLLASAATENPGRFVLVDVDGTDASWRSLPAALATGEPRLALRAGAVWVPRLTPTASRPPLAPPGGTGPWRLDLAGPRGSLAALALLDAPAAAAPLAAGAVRVAVRAAGANFRDALNVLGLYPGDAGPLGLEGAGVVVEVGSAVTTVTVGDRVMGMFSGAFGPLAVADHRRLIPIPDGWSFVEAATAPVVYLTAYHALVELARIQPGESLLVHAAAGGVGLAATALARHLGAEVFATASPGKWAFLRERGIGADRVASSRDLGFAEAFRRAAPDGISVVLNALAGDYVDASLGLLAEGGRFVEMGKTDVRDPAVVAADHPGVSYQAFDLTLVDPDDIAAMLAELAELFARGVLAPLPATVWDVRRAPDALRHLGAGRHIGKIVLTVPAPLDPAGTVLVTGGTGGLGALAARHLVAAHGARRLLLVSRRGEAADGAAALRAELAAAGADVTIAAVDVADRSALAALLAGVPVDAPLTAVVHAAGLLEDGVVTALTP